MWSAVVPRRPRRRARVHANEADVHRRQEEMDTPAFGRNCLRGGRDLVGRIVRALRWRRATRVTPREWGAGVPGGARADYGTAAARYKAAGTEAPERTHGAERTTRAPVGTRATRAKRATTAAGGGDSRAGGCEQERDVGQTALHGVRGVSSTALPVHLACGVVTGAGAVHRFDGGPCGAHRPSVACDLPRRMRRAARRRRGLRHRHL